VQADPHAKERPVEPTRERAYQRRIAELEAEVAELKAQVARLAEQIAKLSKNSSNSSKPPSSDIVKPSKPAPSKKTKRKIGGQPGHAKHQRPPFSGEEIDDVREYRLNRCPDCGGAVSTRAKAARVGQVPPAERVA
jgi:transposase